MTLSVSPAGKVFQKPNALLEAEREVCYRCRKARVMCYCEGIVPFASNPQFVILIHPKETRKAINTGRMAFRCLTNASLIVGHDFSDDPSLMSIIENPKQRCFLLFPGREATDISEILPNEGVEPVTDVYIILDATWSMAKKMYTLSKNLQALPQVMFRPPQRSRFAIRKQPGDLCFSTIETIHHILNVSGKHPAGELDRLLAPFDDMVQRQIAYERANAPQVQ